MMNARNADFVQAQDPISLFEKWMAEAEKTELNDPNAMSIATVDHDGLPNVRIVLLKDFDARGFTFYTNFESQKGQEILAHKKVALCFHWKSQRRQIRARGPVEIVTAAEADDYYNSRSRGSRIGAWASDQSRPLDSRETLIDRSKEVEARFDGQDIFERPPHWSGFRLIPQEIEFWQDGEFRLHDRVRFTASDQGLWSGQRLFP